MDERLAKLEAKVDQLNSSLQKVEAQLADLHQRLFGAAPAPGAATPGPAGAGKSKSFAYPWPLPWARVVFLAGRTCLILGGAFLLRALTDMGVFPARAGLAAGLGYALLWLVFTEFSARGGNLLGPTFYITCTAMTAYPLLWEAATKFGVLTGLQSAVVVGLVTLLALGVVWRRSLRIAAWLVLLPAVFASFALQVATCAIEPHVIALLLIGTAAVWIAYGRRWPEICLLPALGVDLAVLNRVWLASRPEGLPESYRHLALPAVPVLALALLLVYLASFAVQTLLRKHEVSAFEILQTAAGLAIGFGGAVRAANAMGSGKMALGGVALMLAVACYAVAYSIAELRWLHRRNFMFYAWQALVLAVSGCALVTSGFNLHLLLCAGALGTAWLGARFQRLTLHYHSAVYLGAAAHSAGLLALSVESLMAPASWTWQLLTPSSLAVLASTLAGYFILAFAKANPKRSASSQIPKLAVAVLAALGAGAVAVIVLLRGFGSLPPKADAALVASVRSAVLAATAVLLAAASRRREFQELKWLVLALLIGGGAKLLFEDLPHGRPATLFLAFAAYGAALIVAPWLLRSKKGGNPEPGLAGGN